MKLTSIEGDRGARSALAALVARLLVPVRAVGASRWGGPLARAAFALVGLVVLAAIGRSALAGSGAPKPEPEPNANDPPAVPAAAAATSPVATTAKVVVASAAPSSAPAAVPASATGDTTVPAPQLETSDAGAPRSRATPDAPVFLNQASLADLRRLPGVGDKKGKAILALRDRLHGFSQIEDLLKVKGMGRKSLKRLRPLVRLDLLAPAPAQGDRPSPGEDGGAATP